jgi:putative molybdopterin biosynthesis protein
MPAGLVESGPAEGVEDEDTEGRDADPSSDGPGGEMLVYPVDKGSGATTSLVEADGIVSVPADTDYLAAGERVTVELFSADVRPPSLLGVGEDDPVLWRLLDSLSNLRYLAVGSREGLRRLRDGVPDVAVIAGPTRRDVEGERLGGWQREWGLVVPRGNPERIEVVADLVDRDLRLVNRGTDSGVRTSLGNAVAALADERGVDRRDLVAAIEGFDLTMRAHESPARKVATGEADAGVGLRATADRLGLGFVSLGDQEVKVVAAPGRAGKPGVEELERRLAADAETVVNDLPGYDTLD